MNNELKAEVPTSSMDLKVMFDKNKTETDTDSEGQEVINFTINIVDSLKFSKISSFKR